ncbi:PLP-dependent aminotransferase family protein [Cupriavidus taiwanensis]|uniref:aminotransferase-like domain-containing protein n=1 Tax=Cupriavidus taiwanensis TaxID=164546 RepID=UPI000E19B5F3|nr:PLP-dependent aminotransferase family protein [Cupriavidus taiwanensis]SOZ33509.1 2-aminoadipate transaminase [Cupriavidus taiwanensis]SPA25460.1 2-aminoadipate transaminase [Cupriavidus taiwanensis]
MKLESTSEASRTHSEPFQLSRRAQALTSSVIREVLKLTEKPEIISFAGGLPAAQTFPVDALRAACNRVFVATPESALQYGPTEGFQPLRQWVAEKHNVDPARVLITTGSQQALDLLGKVFIDPGSKVLVEAPTYLGALQAFSIFEPDYMEVPTDDNGLQVDQLSASLADGARFLYTIPNFQNPTGRELSLTRRQALVERARALGLLLVEDNPYGELRYSGTPIASLHSMHPEGVVYLGSFSKILAPGLRLGYMLAPASIHAKLVQAKQASDLHTPTFTQRLAWEVLSTGMLDQHVASVCDRYGKHCAAMLDALSRHMPAGVRWSEPRGGMFIWVDLPPCVDAMALLQESVASQVAFVPGAPFYANSPRPNTLRLAFVTVPPAQIETGIARLGHILARHL